MMEYKKENRYCKNARLSIKMPCKGGCPIRFGRFFSDFLIQHPLLQGISVFKGGNYELVSV